jgi:hypothetical protein
VVPDPVEIPLEEVLGMIEWLEGVVVELEQLGEAHLAFAVHSEVRDLLDRILPERDE